jgi:hypothetical protein
VPDTDNQPQKFPFEAVSQIATLGDDVRVLLNKMQYLRQVNDVMVTVLVDIDGETFPIDQVTDKALRCQYLVKAYQSASHQLITSLRQLIAIGDSIRPYVDHCIDTLQANEVEMQLKETEDQLDHADPGST